MHRITSLTRSGTTASTSTAPKRIDIERSSNGPVHGRTETNKQRCTTASLPRSKTPLGPTPISTSRQRSTSKPRDYQQAALDAWIDHDRRGSVVLPTGSGKTFLGLQAIADAGVSALVVTPTIDLMNQWHATLTNAFGEQLPEPVGVPAVAATTSPRSPSPPTTAPIGTSTSMATSSGYSSSMRNTTCQRRPTVKSLR